MNLIKTEWKKIWYGKKIVHMLIMCFAVSLFCIALMIMAKSNSSFFGVMQAYYEVGKNEPSIMPDDTEISPENSIGYILGLNDWNKPKGFEIYRSATTIIQEILIPFFVKCQYSKAVNITP